MIEKCRYFNDHHSACTLMMDDLSLTATTLDGHIKPSVDWGYGLNGKNSLYGYLENSLFSKYPEVKGTFFYVLKRHALQNSVSGYRILFRAHDQESRAFFDHVSDSFEVAFHGITHGRYINPRDPSLPLTNWDQEFEYLMEEDLSMIRAEIEKFEDFSGKKITGGKYPGYLKNDHSEKILEELDIKWWASSADMLGRKCKGNRHGYFGSRCQILDFPTNISGDIFNGRLHERHSWKSGLRGIKRIFDDIRGAGFLQYLYEERNVISIQEHFQTLRTDGQRQTPGIYDDTSSLDRIFGILRGADIWYATCSEIAHYLESYDNTEISREEAGCFKLSYRGNWSDVFISVKSVSSHLKNVTTGKISHGVYKNGNYVFNGIMEGVYAEIY